MLARELLERLLTQSRSDDQELARTIWERRDRFIRWPMGKPRLLLRNWIRQRHQPAFPADVLQALKVARVRIDRRSNGPAICAFLYAEGERPNRYGDLHGWHIHHIYDGRFPAPGRERTLHAVKDGDHFTHSAGLVAVHPVADALADEVPYFAWLLRAEAYRRFNKYDPDGVFDPQDQHWNEPPEEDLT